MTIENTWKVSGTINPLKETSMSTWNGEQQLKGWISQRDIARVSNGDAVGNLRYIVGMKFTARDPEIVKTIIALDQARQGAKYTVPVTFTGRVTQWVAKSKTGGDDTFVYDLEVHTIEVL